MSKRLFCGIDPGLGGAIALLDSDGNYVWVIDMPVMSEGKKNIVNASQLAKELQPLVDEGHTIFCALERVQSRPGQNVSAVFRFGEGYGVIQGVLGALQIPLTLVTPPTWKRYWKLLGADKDASRGCAQRLFPAAPLHLKRHDGRSESLLVARWLYEENK